MSALRTSTRLIALVAVVLIGLMNSLGAVGAAENQDLGVSPTVVVDGQVRPYFTFFASPGTEVRDTVSLTNKTEHEIVLDLYAADAIATDDGAFALEKDDDAKDDVGAWVQLPTTTVTVPPLTEVKVPFIMRVPEDATPGDHVGGIVALDTAEYATSSGGDTNLSVRNGVATRIYTRVNGPLVPALSVTQVSIDKDTTLGSLFGLGSPATVRYTVVNSGNVRLSADAVVEATATIGGGASLPSEPLPELVPGASVTIERALGDVSSIGSLTVKVGVASAAPDPVAAAGQASLFSVPWLLLLVLAALVVVAVVAVRRRRRGHGPVPPAPAPEEELVGA